MPGDGVDGEVPASQIFIDVIGELHGGSATESLDVSPKGGDLVHAFPRNDPHRPVLHADGHDPAEHRPHLLRTGAGGQIPVARIGASSRQGVPYDPSDGPCVEARPFQLANQPAD